MVFFWLGCSAIFIVISGKLIDFGKKIHHYLDVIFDIEKISSNSMICTKNKFVVPTEPFLSKYSANPSVQ